ncbi:putative ubiquitin-protein ligase E3 component [Rosellinia necatrix]|uniref:E3 ubiquitin-protein ligase n=1 Tax=Rosellinia necatrix TaxID=77044 RepID=A0A1W2TD94_ROSNE|nr:putative ubiquitin-protein ligase E3 component [Rosellinia necatrix]
MDNAMSTQEQQLCDHLRKLPRIRGYRYDDAACHDLLYNLFWSMAGGRADDLRLFFPDGKLNPKGPLKLREAQGALEGAEYTEAARGKACGHIFRAGEATYSCKTCSTDDTCCLCSKCFDSTDHTGHMVRISISPGNSGCCDCGDPEAWKLPMFCTIHSECDQEQLKGKGKEAASVSGDLLINIRMTVSRVLDFICDVISCAPEQLRHPKTKESIERDERMSRLASTYNGGDVDSPEEFALLIWNDEKHTVNEVQDQVARACSTTLDEGYNRAVETDSMGRSILKYDTDLKRLLRCATILEQIKIAVTIRSSRDTFREQMCGTMIEWLNDIAGCSVGNDHNILRTVVCEELLKPWRRGSPGSHAIPGKDGLEDEAKTDPDAFGNPPATILFHRARLLGGARIVTEFSVSDGDNEDEDDEMDEGDRTSSSGEDEDEDEDDADDDDDDDDGDVMMVDARPATAGDVNHVTDWIGPTVASLEEEEATMAGYPPPPPPPPPVPRRAARDRDLTPSDSDTAEPLIAPTVYAKANLEIPKTPGLAKAGESRPPRPGRYWVETPAAYTERDNLHPYEDVFQRVRLDWLVLFDLRMWKKVRNDLRALYISTVVTIPEFKRILGLRFAALYTTLAQLYLINDREPDHSIINISLQMLTTPSITAEVVERGNFLTTLMAIIYTFLTTRQVGHPFEVASNAVLGFDTGSVANRRMYHFYVDLKYLLGSPHVQEHMRTEERYLLQFLDLVKLHQGICPNVRAIGEHVEYETDSWIGASLMTREINKLCRLLGGSFRHLPEQDSLHLSQAIRLTAKLTILNSIGAERARFTQSEIKDETRFKMLTDFEFAGEGTKYDVVKFVVEEQPISFHHALHSTLSWLIECGKHMSIQQLRSILSFTAQELKMKPKSMGRKSLPKRDYAPEDYLMATFDFPLRVCTWLAQIKASMWVRNGISLRHQAMTYRNILTRDVTHARDIFLLQTAMVVCDPGRVLASIIDRFGMESWVKGLYEITAAAQDATQHLDVVEDMIHLLIVLLSDRTALIPTADEQQTHLMALHRDITHILCFRPLSFNEISSKLPEKFQEHEDFHRVLDEVAIFKHPEGVSDVGTFELKPQFIEDIDPYVAHYNKNQREESEAAYRKWMAKKTGKPVEEIVYEPRLTPIETGAFVGLGEFTSTGMFAQIIYYALLYPLVAARFTPKVPFTRVETFLHVVLHLILIAIAEDKSSDTELSDSDSFVRIALTTQARSNFMADSPATKTIVSLLDLLSTKEEFKACHPKIGLILKRMRQRSPGHFDTAYLRLGIPLDRIDTASPANTHNDEEERERKKRAALDRQAKVMAQFQQQQKSFLEMQGDIDWGEEELDDLEDTEPMEERKNLWKYPRGTCILCQEETDDGRLYGTFALFTESLILRQTDLQDPDFVREAANTPVNLDRSAEEIRPFGLAHENRTVVEKVDSTGRSFMAERQGIGKGFPANLCRPGPVSVGCGHIMHFSCFDTYLEATIRRHGHQIARHHPESLERLEFVCPLCKALGNAFLPITWDGKEESYPGILQSSTDFNSFIDQCANDSYISGRNGSQALSRIVFSDYLRTNMPETLAEITREHSWESSTAHSTPSSTPFGEAFSSTTTPGSSVRSRSPEARTPSSELTIVYRRLQDTLRKNGLLPSPESDSNDEEWTGSNTLARSVGYSISAAEIQQRGIEAQYGMSLIEKMPEQLLIQLRILSETVSTYISVGGLRHSGDNRIEREFRQNSESQRCRLFVSQSGNRSQHPPLLHEDPFIFMCEATFGLSMIDNIDPMHLVRICYLAEIVKVAYQVSRNIPLSKWLEDMGSRNTEDPAMNNFANFFHHIIMAGMDVSAEIGETANDLPNAGFDQPALDGLANLHSFVKKYALAFLRKTTILLHVYHGVDFNNHISPDPEADELTRLTAALRLPSFDEMCTSLTTLSNQFGWSQRVASLVDGWISHQTTWRAGRTVADHGKYTLSISAQISHPGIFELVGLPKNYDTLIDECSKRRCPKTGKDLADPIVCLMCGDIFCGQTMCCLMEFQEGPNKPMMRIGGAQQHMRFKCQSNIGLFINVRKCAIFYAHRVSGSYSNAPYIDRYGEVDMGLRHGRQLYLSQKRYDSMVRNLWLVHGIPSFISRKLEADINNGGWETV